MKYLFLDIDGVLNHYEFYMRDDKDSSISYPLSEFDPDCIKRVKEVIEDTGARIVLSSTWRIDGKTYMSNIFSKLGLPTDFDMTPFLESGIRGEEIQRFLDHHQCNNYVILDDDTDILDSQKDHFVKCSASGFNDDCTKKAILILNS